MTILRHVRAVEAAAASVLLTAAVTSLPLLAADQYDESYYANYIVSVFQKVGAENTNVYSTGDLASSAFDFARYFSDTCFRPTTFDEAGCKEKYGPYANLKETYDSGTLATLLSRTPHLKGIVHLLPGGAALQNSSSSSVPATIAPSVVIPTAQPAQSTIDEERTERGARVWKICGKKFDNRNDATLCYQRNIRIIMTRTEDITVDMIR